MCAPDTELASASCFARPTLICFSSSYPGSGQIQEASWSPVLLLSLHKQLLPLKCAPQVRASLHPTITTLSEPRPSTRLPGNI